MGFFEDLPVPEPREQPRHVEPEWRRIPHEFVPCGAAIGQLIFASPEIAVVLSDAEVYPTGFSMSVTATRHPEVPSPPPGRSTVGSINLVDLLHGRGTGVPGEQFRIGVLLDDGRRTAYPFDMTRAGRGERPQASIWPQGGGGTGDMAAARFFVWPIPDSGDLTLLFLWEAAGLAETRVVLPGDVLRAAAADATEIWPGARPPS